MSDGGIRRVAALEAACRALQTELDATRMALRVSSTDAATLTTEKAALLDKLEAQVLEQVRRTAKAQRALATAERGQQQLTEHLERHAGPLTIVFVPNEFASIGGSCVPLGEPCERAE
uniref:Uncharacterized protein n=1 Tax=Haptolina ericina TaxID=156174 RepID=A0A7S3F1K5_9EUKA